MRRHRTTSPRYTEETHDMPLLQQQQDGFVSESSTSQLISENYQKVTQEFIKETQGACAPKYKKHWMVFGITISSVIVVGMIILLIFVMVPDDTIYQIEVEKTGTVLISPSNSDFDNNFNAATWLIASEGNSSLINLAVQVQTQDADDPFADAVSAIALTRSTDTLGDAFEYVSEANVIFSAASPELAAAGIDAARGVEGPRVWYYAARETYYMFFTAVADDGAGGEARRLAWASSDDGLAFAPIGYVFSEDVLSAFGAPYAANVDGALKDVAPVLMLWGEPGGGTDIYAAEAADADLSAWGTSRQAVLSRRNGFFDSAFLAPGPPPVRLRNGKWFLLYNAASETGAASVRPDWGLEFHIGWAILDDASPLTVLARSEEPILSASYDWETCNSTAGEYPPRAPFTVATEGVWHSVAEEDREEYSVIYQGCGKYTSKFFIRVSF
eukprot:gnl/Chilomastix_cuspidata/5537.p1 GENE.gnl/Chilomastix_cuspidata/5537~~gnl/Chilomastix_cuspidata/5537.p1  ORF type:complete len:451 (+),score=179.07 gnl/Chilomastix_cuspidata/5537:27-1355(+)